MTPVLVRMPPALLAQIDAERGDIPRAVFIRRACERAIGPVAAALKADLLTIKSAPEAQSKDKAPKPFKSRLKGEWKAP